MKNRLIQGFLLLSATLPLAGLADAPSASTAVLAHKAIVPMDNDILPDVDNRAPTTPVPNELVKTFSNIVSDAYDSYAKDNPDCLKSIDECGLDKASMFGRTYLLDGPGRNQLYVFVLNGLYGQTQYYFFLYSPITHRFTDKPASIYGKWLDGFYGDKDGPQLLKSPFVEFKDVGKETFLVVEDYAHNGSVYNAAVYRYFRIGKDLSLKQILALEARAIWSFGDDDSAGLLLRELKFIDAKSAVITTYLQPYKVGSPRRLVGHVKIGSSGDGMPFKVLERWPADDSMLKDTLITVNSDENDDDFLSQGDNLFY